jgi:hypothetical protein
VTVFLVLVGAVLAGAWVVVAVLVGAFVLGVGATDVVVVSDVDVWTTRDVSAATATLASVAFADEHAARPATAATAANPTTILLMRTDTPSVDRRRCGDGIGTADWLLVI